MPQANDPFRFRLATLLIGTATVAFVVYATVQPSVWAASFGFTVAVVVLSLGLVRAVVSNGLRRRYLLAFSLAGLAYMGVLYLPGIDERIGSRLLSSVAFAEIDKTVYVGRDFQSSDQVLKLRARQRGAVMMWMEADAMGNAVHRNAQSIPFVLPQETWAARAFHSMFAIVIGLVAGWVAMLPVRREFKDDTAVGGVVE
ncbi:hypothetical protein [Aeoliella sp. SH292]|uniref:hypothetical protein n=1 Tax=Aeoliella sp. SH292 TaxID=3454464 RepID=UPI003F9C4A21